MLWAHQDSRKERAAVVVEEVAAADMEVVDMEAVDMEEEAEGDMEVGDTEDRVDMAVVRVDMVEVAADMVEVAMVANKEGIIKHLKSPTLNVKYSTALYFISHNRTT